MLASTGPPGKGQQSDKGPHGFQKQEAAVQAIHTTGAICCSTCALASQHIPTTERQRSTYLAVNRVKVLDEVQVPRVLHKVDLQKQLVTSTESCVACVMSIESYRWPTPDIIQSNRKQVAAIEARILPLQPENSTTSPTACPPKTFAHSPGSMCLLPGSFSSQRPNQKPGYCRSSSPP